MIQFTAIDIVGDELELLQLAGSILQARLFDEKHQKKFMVQVQVTGQQGRLPVQREQMLGKSGLSYKPPHEFSMVVSLANGLADAIDMLAHELIHISQLRYGRLRVSVKKKKINGVKQPVYFAKWPKNKLVAMDQLAYQERGWELEAFQWQTVLRMDAIALMLGTPHQLHLQSKKHGLVLFEASGPAGVRPPTTPQVAAVASGNGFAQSAPQQQQPPVMQQPAMVQPVIASAPPMAAPPMAAPKMPPMVRPVMPPVMPPVATPPVMPPVATPPVMPPPVTAPPVTTPPVTERAVSAPISSEMPAMPAVPMPEVPVSIEPTSFKQAEPPLAGDALISVSAMDENIAPTSPEFGAEPETISEPTSGADAGEQEDLLQEGALEIDARDALDGQSDFDDADDVAPPPATLPDIALDDDVLAALMADDEAEPKAEDVHTEPSSDASPQAEEVGAEPEPELEPQTQSAIDAPSFSPQYDPFGSAPDLSDLNASATDTSEAFQQQRFVDVEGVDEARPLDSSAVDAKLKDLQARGLADADVSRAKSSEELQ